MRLRDGERADNCTGCRCGKRADHRAGGCRGERDGQRAGGSAHRADAGVSPRPFVAGFGIFLSG